MHEQITALGWAWHGYCKCASTGKVYKKGQFTLKYFENRRYFELRLRNRVVSKGADEILISQINHYDQMGVH